MLHTLKVKRSEIRKVRKNLTVLQGALEQGIERSEHKSEIKCRKGCAACCRQVVTMSTLEGIAILWGILGDETLRPWFMREAYPKLREQYHAVMSEEMTGALWFEKRIPCMFLDESDNTCKIYDHRPMVCRTLIVLSDPENCKPPGGKEIKRLNAGAVVEAQIEREMALGEKMGIPVQVVPLPVALYWALRVLFYGRKDLKEFLRGTPFEDDRQAVMYWAMKIADKAELDRFLNMPARGE